jgi:cytochrome c556
MKRLILALAFTATAAFAQGNVIEQRKGQFKEMGGAAKAIGEMLKGEKPFDKAVSAAAFATIAKVSGTVPTLFPAGSYTGDTTASPKIADEKAKFEAMFVELGKSSMMLASADEAAFKAGAGGLLKQCGTCHETYRIKK